MCSNYLQSRKFECCKVKEKPVVPWNSTGARNQNQSRNLPTGVLGELEGPLTQGGVVSWAGGVVVYSQ